MVGYVKSYGGRPDPKPGKKLSDCVIRALCELTGIDWYEEHVVNLQSVQLAPGAVFYGLQQSCDFENLDAQCIMA